MTLPNMTGIRGLERRPTHPGEILRENVLPALGLTQKEFANNLGVSRFTVSELLHEKRGVTPDMAIRLSPNILRGEGAAPTGRSRVLRQSRVFCWSGALAANALQGAEGSYAKAGLGVD